MKQVIELNPNEKHLQQINEWLHHELNQFENGFYHNWNIIKRAFEEHRMIVSLADEKPVAFLIFSKMDLWCEIDILNVKEEFKGRGIGSALFKSLERHLKEMEYYAIKLFCEPRESERFWKKMNFIKAPSRGFADHDLTYWKPIVLVIEANDSEDQIKNRIEIWDKECVKPDDEPTWIYDLNKNGHLVAYVNYDWKAIINVNNVEIDNCKLKYLRKEYDKYLHAPFLIIREEEIKEIIDG